jgi:thiosulfate dehydrogenase [quinone] large subunit
MKNVLSEKNLLLVAQMILGYEWVMGGIEKILKPEFVPGMGKTLEYFASKNPHEWFVFSILSFAQSHSVAFGQLVQWGELVAGIGLVLAAVWAFFNKLSKGRVVISVLCLIALIGGLLMNAAFYFAAGWTGPGTAGLNVVMFWLQVVLMGYWGKTIARSHA